MCSDSLCLSTPTLYPCALGAGCLTELALDDRELRSNLENHVVVCATPSTSSSLEGGTADGAGTSMFHGGIGEGAATLG